MANKSTEQMWKELHTVRCPDISGEIRKFDDKGWRPSDETVQALYDYCKGVRDDTLGSAQASLLVPFSEETGLEAPKKPVLTRLGVILGIDPKIMEMGGLWYLPGMNANRLSKLIGLIRDIEIKLTTNRNSTPIEITRLGGTRINNLELALVWAHRQGHIQGLRDVMEGGENNCHQLITSLLDEQEKSKIPTEERIRQVASICEASQGSSQLMKTASTVLSSSSYWGKIKDNAKGLKLVGIDGFDNLFPDAIKYKLRLPDLERYKIITQPWYQAIRTTSGIRAMGMMSKF